MSKVRKLKETPEYDKVLDSLPTERTPELPIVYTEEEQKRRAEKIPVIKVEFAGSVPNMIVETAKELNEYSHFGGYIDFMLELYQVYDQETHEFCTLSIIEMTRGEVEDLEDWGELY